MNLQPVQNEPDGDNVSLQNLEIRPSLDHELVLTASNSQRPTSKEHHGSRYLQAPPFQGPMRPLSPDTLSNLSIDEYQQLHAISNIKHRPQSKTWKGKIQIIWERNLGLLYMLIAQLFGTMMNVATRFLEIEGNKGKGLHPAQIIFARMGITVVLASGYMWYMKTPYFPFGRPEVRWLLICRGLGGFFGVFGIYYSLMYLPLADATVITFLSPGLTCYACSILIKESFTRVDKFGTLVSFLGVIFIAKPTSFFQMSSPSSSADGTADGYIMPHTNTTKSPTNTSDASNYDNVTAHQRIGAVAIALVGVLGSVTAYTSMRWIGRQAHPLISVNYFATWCTFVTLALQMLPGVGFLLPADLKEWGLLFFLGTCGFVMQFLLAAGLAYEKSSRATNMTYTSMLFALGFDRFFFGTTPSITSIIGSTLILSSAVCMAMQRGDSPKVQDGDTRVEDTLYEEQGLMTESDGEDTLQER